MLTVEEIREILERSSGGIVDVISAAQAIYEAQGVGDDPWIELHADGNSSTYFLQCLNGRIYRHVMEERPSVAENGAVNMSLCFVPGEGCGE